MAPELRKRKSKEPVAGAKSASKSNAVPLATKRKAPDDASPVAAKKSKPIKDSSRSKKAKADRSTETNASKSSRSAKVTKKIEDEINNEEEDAKVSDDEQDEAKALANIVDSDDEEEAVADTDVAFQEGQDVGEIPKESKKLLKSSKSEDNEHGVVYIGRLPHGFYEREMHSYFSQFGGIEKLRMSRNKKTGASKHFAFIEFASAAVAEVVAKTMDNYLLFGRILKVKVVPKSQIHDDLWKGSNKRFKKVPWNKMAGNQLKKPLSESTWTQKITKEEQKRSNRAKKLQDIGYEFEGPKLKSVEEVPRDPPAFEGADDEVPKAIEAAPEAPEPTTVEKEPKEASDDALAVKEPATISRKGAGKSSKKGKKSSKAKKAAA
ncbi:hypothetical protein F4804DRAFT_297655 [Jackrogersella minutella]|nr:hypothetical protein F4804DRAFT_297655 [Jackrogersella minutella]